MLEAITTTDAPPPGGGYSQAIRAGSLLFISGQMPRDRERNVLEGPFAAQVDLVFDNLEAIAKQAGASLADTARLTVYLRDMGDQPQMDEVFRRRFAAPRPARTTVQSNLPVAVEIDAIVALPRADPA